MNDIISLCKIISNLPYMELAKVVAKQDEVTIEEVLDILDRNGYGEKE